MENLIFYTIPGILLLWLGISFFILKKKIQLPPPTTNFRIRRLSRRVLQDVALR